MRKEIVGTLIRVKLQPGDLSYSYLTTKEYEKALEEGQEFFESYRFVDCYVDEQGNLRGKEITGEEALLT